ncbi:MAG: hypothetical protein ACE5J2_08860 [Nitrososphaerales archaeon]
MAIEGNGFLDELERKLKEMEHGLSEEGVQQWAQKVESWAKTLGGEKAEDLRIVVKKVGSKIDLDVNAYAKEEKECLKQAIKTNLPQMPETTGAIFQAMLSRLEQS